MNCERVEELGIKVMEKTIGQKFEKLKLARKDRVTPLALVAPRSKAKEIEHETYAFFLRMCGLGVTDNKLRDYIKFELASTPPALFCNGFMRHNTKSDLTKRYKPVLGVLINLRKTRRPVRVTRSLWTTPRSRTARRPWQAWTSPPPAPQ